MFRARKKAACLIFVHNKFETFYRQLHNLLIIMKLKDKISLLSTKWAGTQQALADASGLPLKTISRWINGSGAKKVQRAKLTKIADATGIDIIMLADDSVDLPPLDTINKPPEIKKQSDITIAVLEERIRNLEKENNRLHETIRAFANAGFATADATPASREEIEAPRANARAKRTGQSTLHPRTQRELGRILPRPGSAKFKIRQSRAL